MFLAAALGSARELPRRSKVSNIRHAASRRIEAQNPLDQPKWLTTKPGGQTGCCSAPLSHSALTSFANHASLSELGKSDSQKVERGTPAYPLLTPELAQQVVISRKSNNPLKTLVPLEGLEPPLPCEKQILSLPRLPFRHRGMPLRRPA